MKFSRQQRAVVIVIVAILVVIGGTVGAYFSLRPHSAKTTVPIRAITSLTQLRTSLAKALPAANITIAPAGSSDSLAYKLKGNRYYTGIDSGAPTLDAAQTVTSMSQYTPLMATVTTTLTSDGLAAQSASSQNNPLAPFYIANWASATLTCDVYGQGDSKTAVYNQATQSNHYSKFDVAIECASISDFSATAKVAAPYYQAFTAATQNKDTIIVFGTPVVTVSKTSGYKIAQVPMINHLALSGSSIGLFYQTPNGAWNYFMNTTGIIACPYYNTTDIQKAFLGTKCQSAGTSSDTVSVKSDS